MASSIPKFENKESIEQYLDNVKLQHLNAEFDTLCKIPQQPDPEQHAGSGRTRLIQPIYFVYSNQQIGYVEVDITDENAMRNLSELLQK